MQQNRQRGGQPGNRNAVKHGYYSRGLNKEQKKEFNLAAGIDGIDEEITLLRYKIRESVTSGDLANLIPLSKIAYALEKLVRTNKKYFHQENAMETGIRNIIREMLLPMGGVNLLRTIAHHQYPDEFPSVSEENSNEKTNPPQNEANPT